MSEEPVQPAEDADEDLTEAQVAALDAEGETPPEEPAEAPPADEEPTPPATDAAMEKTFKQLESATKSYYSRVSSILGDDSLGFVECPLCIVSAIRGMVNVNDAGNLHPDHKALVMHFLGVSREIAYEPDPETRECPACKGEGKTATGSKVEEWKTHKCPNCRGFGFFPPPTLGVHADLNGGTHELTPEDFAPPLEHADVDNWNEPRILPDGRENPNYGKQPQFKIPVPPWGTTAGLTAQDVAT